MSADPGNGATRTDVHTDTGATRMGGEGRHAHGAHDAHDGHTAPTGGDVRHDRIRWGAVWTGVLTTVSLYVVLQLLFVALGWLDLGVEGEGSGTTRAVVSGVLGLVAFLLGGMAAGASALWRRANDGMINGVVSWAATVVALLVLALIGGGALVGSLADVAVQNADTAAASIDPAAAAQAGRESAGWAALGLGLSVVAAALGGSLGAKMWPGRGDRDADRR
ncbi:permease [Pseudonocardia broussonetiae]|uniref:Permease n=1 Tax=Pseudonocardia broussonetiae TaxID=2736640 RepID=A0A6M6JTL7_9PSEU|nr:permease [Pseudonocardia broussonetiae]QJY49902.1 permease [Pseudonocardia broussonetiae]